MTTEGVLRTDRAGPARSDVVVAAVAVGQTALFVALLGAFIWLTLSGLRNSPQPARRAQG